MADQFNIERAILIGQALARIPDAVWEAIDLGEPEWPFLKRIIEEKSNLKTALGIAVALSDFQIGTGGAQKYWPEAEAAYRIHKPVDSIDKIARIMDDLMKRPVAARLAQMKRKRVARFLSSAVVGPLSERSIADLGKNPMELWSGLAMAMRQKPDDKTIVFAMKIFDLMHKAETGRYVRFPANVPIPVDLRIGRVTLACGLIDAPPGKRIDEAMESIDEMLSKEKGRILAAWARVSEEAGGLSLFRIDSLVWQIGEPIFKHRLDPGAAKVAISGILEGYSCPADLSCLAGEALCRL